MRMLLIDGTCTSFMNYVYRVVIDISAYLPAFMNACGACWGTSYTHCPFCHFYLPW
jgi:hypothetical protein